MEILKMNKDNKPQHHVKFKRGNKPSAKSLANLRPAQKGEVRNPWGTKGKNGDSLRLKQSYRDFMTNISDKDKIAVWQGLLDEGKKGNVAAIKMLIELGGEQVNDRLTEMAELAANVPSLTIQIVDPSVDGLIEVLPDNDMIEHSDDNVDDDVDAHGDEH